MRRNTIISFSLLLLLFVLQSTYTLAGITGKITGHVSDANTNEPLIGANIMIDGTRYGAATSSSGRYVLLNIPPGRYTLKIHMMGYQTKAITDVYVSSDYTTTINAKLQSEVLAGEQVTVTAERPLIQTDLTSTAVAIPESRISSLPAEEMEQFLKLQAGVTVDTKGEIHIRGGRSTEIAYMIDGIPVTDGFDRSQAIDVDNSSIQELQVISGTFNAEYGQAQSGVVNIITKKGTQRFSGELSVYSGDYLSSHSDLFYNIDNRDFLAEQNLIARISGPVPKLNSTFFIAARATNNDGWLYGRREFAMPILSDKTLGYTTGNSHAQPGDWSYVPMNDANRVSLHGNLSLNWFDNVPISWSFFYNKSKEQAYDQRYARLPEADSPSYLDSWNHIISINYVLSPSTFFAANYSRFNKHTERYLYENPLDRRWLFPAISTEQIYRRYMLEGLEYVTDQSNNEQYFINNLTDIFKLDFTSQFHPLHWLKTGVEFKHYKLDYEYFEVINKPDNKVENLFIPYVDDVSTPRHDDYSNTPIEAAFYVQDKIEFHEIVINAGVRYDYFDSRGYLPSVLDEKTGNRLSAPLKRASVKQRFSPRFGLAFPISDQGVIHFSYGHFTQIPDFRSLFWNSEYEIRLGALSTEVGNPDLEPEQTVSWELGVQQQIADDMAIYATVYFKDITNLLGQEIIRLKGGQAYARYINRDYGNVRGVMVALEKRPTRFLSVNVDYTYQQAMGNASDPFAVFTDNQGTPPRESEKQVLPLNWDQRHTINATATFSKPNRWGISFILQAGSGLPYTPTDPDQSLRIAFENSERKPATFNVDMMAHYDFHVWGMKPSVFMKVYNVFDMKNEIDVFTDTGRASFTHTLNYRLGDRRPDFYSAPRLLMVGAKVGF
ncbi:TonB-dependent receptor [candidate division KSB1 bacterium]|nr:TonB-dependent receptor [candidate division KSB1 bacterium]